MSLFDMMDISDPNVLACMDNYRIRLISPAQMSDSEIMKFQSSLREVMLFIKHSRDMNKLEAILTTNRERFSNLERRAADVIKVITHSDFEYAENEVKVNMCQAILDMKQKSKDVANMKKNTATNFNNYEQRLYENLDQFYANKK